MGLIAGPSTYEYADSNPLRLFDLLGLATSYTGQATYYKLVGYKTASGTKLDGAALAAAVTGEKAKLGTTVTVTYTRPDGRKVSICVTVNDRGPFARDAKGRPLKPLQPDANDIIDLTPAAFRQLAGDLKQGRLDNVTVPVP